MNAPAAIPPLDDRDFFRNLPDMRKAAPLAEMLAQLDDATTDFDAYARLWVDLIRATGCHCSVTWWRDGERSFGIGWPCDRQERVRRTYMEALTDHYHDKVPDAREALIAETVRRGWYADNRPVSRDIAEPLISAVLATGGHLMINPDGRYETWIDGGLIMSRKFAGTVKARAARAAAIELMAFERRIGAKALLCEIVKERGRTVDHGWVVLKADEVMA